MSANGYGGYLYLMFAMSVVKEGGKGMSLLAHPPHTSSMISLRFPGEQFENHWLKENTDSTCDMKNLFHW